MLDFISDLTIGGAFLVFVLVLAEMFYLVLNTPSEEAEEKTGFEYRFYKTSEYTFWLVWGFGFVIASIAAASFLGGII